MSPVSNTVAKIVRGSGAFALAAAIIATLTFSLPADIRGPRNQPATQPDPNTTTRTNP